MSNVRLTGWKYYPHAIGQQPVSMFDDDDGFLAVLVRPDIEPTTKWEQILTTSTPSFDHTDEDLQPTVELISAWFRERGLLE